VAYKQPPVRQLKDAPTSSQAAFTKILEESRIVTRAKTWERQVFALNVVIVVPVVRDSTDGTGKRLCYDTILPHCAEVYTDEADPMGDPVAVVYTAKDGSEYSLKPLKTIVLDREYWRYYDKDDRLIGEVPHNAGVFPGVAFRLSEPVDDWWDSTRGAGLVDATIEVGHLAARMDWVRHGQDRFREFLFSKALAGQPTQVAGAEGPVEIAVDPGEAGYTATNLVVSIDEHVKHIRFYRDEAAESLGVPSVLADFEASGANAGNTSALASAQQQAALADLRASHIDYYREAEGQLSWKTALVLRGMGHPLAGELDPAMVAESFDIQFPDLTFVADPKSRLDVAKQRIDLGLSSEVREYQREHPELTMDEAREQVHAIALEVGELNQFYIEHNIPRASADRMKTLAQVQGAIGGEASGETRKQNDDNADEPGRADDQLG
jgi:hypothetical protein